MIGVVDVGETADGLRYMVMDFAEGPDLATLLVRGADAAASAIIHLTRQLLEGLYHAHEQGLIHRDFKPENVIIERDTHGAEVPRIVDFGIAILREGGDSPAAPGRLTTNGLVLGTPHYMAPEQAVADPIDHRIDLFALGIIVYEMLCGKLPFDGTGAEVARANLLLDPPLIAERVPYLEVDPLLEAFARRLMAKKRDMRPATAKAARELLDLIERDREAAAAALGVPLDAARAADDDAGRRADPRSPRRLPGHVPAAARARAADAAQAPPLAAKTPCRCAARHISTQMTEPLPAAAPAVAADRSGVVGVAGIAAAAFAMLARRKQGAEARDSRSPMATTPRRRAAPIETRAASRRRACSAARRDRRPPRTTACRDATPVETPSPKHAPEARRKAETKHVETKPVEHQARRDQARAAGRDRPSIRRPKTDRYRPRSSRSTSRSARELKALEQAKGADAASDLQSRYRMIRITDAMSTQDKRDAAAQARCRSCTPTSPPALEVALRQERDLDAVDDSGVVGDGVAPSGATADLVPARP